MFYIYKITNNTDSKFYIGKTTRDVDVRFKEHLNECDKPHTYQSHLYNAMQTCGKENFTIEIIDTAETIEELDEKEIYWIAKLDATNSGVGYNIAPGGKCQGRALGSVPWNKGVPMTEEQKKRVSESKKGTIITEEQRAKISKSLKEAYQNGKHPVVRSTKRKGIKASEETRKKISEANKKRDWSHLWKPIRCVETGEIFPSIKSTGLNAGHLCACLNGRQEKYHGYHWEYVI